MDGDKFFILNTLKNHLHYEQIIKAINDAIGSSFKLQHNPLNFYLNTENKKRRERRRRRE